MPITYTVDRKRRLLEVTYSGPISKQEIIDHRLRMDVDPRGVSGFDALVDAETSSVQLSAAEVRELALYIRRYPYPASRRAIVTSSLVEYGHWRLFETLTDGGPRQYRVFQSLDDARAWLGIDPSTDTSNVTRQSR